MLADSDKKEWDYCLVYKLDRFSRNKYEMAIHRKHLKGQWVKKSPRFWAVFNQKSLKMRHF